MKRSVVATLLSGLVFPGAGQIYLGHRRRGWAIVLAVLGALCYFVYQAMGPVLALATEIEEGRLELDPVLIAARLHEQSQGQLDNPMLTLAAVLIIGCWIGSCIDAFILGRRAPGA